MAHCLACETALLVTGWLCEECAAAIHGVTGLLPEQILSVAEPAGGVLIDHWGRPHPLGTRTVIGRQLERGGMAVMQASVSRRHAEIVKKRDGSWWIVDLVSSNGTAVDDEPTSGPHRLASRSSVFIGEIGFFFVTPAPGPPPVEARVPTTHRPSAPKASGDGFVVARLYDASDDGDELGAGAYTFSGLRAVDLTFASPTGGGGGVVEVEGRAVQLTEIQYRLVHVLAERMTAEEGADERVRGFVRSSELLASLPWDTARPEDNHIKQLVRRVRRTLVRSDIGDLIESRQGFGYRLRVRVRRSPSD